MFVKDFIEVAQTLKTAGVADLNDRSVGVKKVIGGVVDSQCVDVLAHS